MFYNIYDCGFSEIIMLSNKHKLTGLYFKEQIDFGYIYNSYQYTYLDIFTQTIKWLNIYFNDKIPLFTPPIELSSTSFRLHVWQILQTIKYGDTATYKDIANIMANARGKRISSQAVGNAISANPISIIIPCHRVIGSNGKLIGYSGGLELKSRLLEIEGFKIN